MSLCRSCGQIYDAKHTKQNICRTCYTNGRVKEKMVYTKKVWEKFSWDTQTKLSTQYEIILTYPKTLKEKAKGIFKRSDKDKRKERRAKLSKVFKKLIKGSTSKSGGNRIAKLSRALNDSSSTNELVSKKRTPKFAKQTKHDDKFDGLMGSHPKYDALLSRKGVPKL